MKLLSPLTLGLVAFLMTLFNKPSVRMNAVQWVAAAMALASLVWAVVSDFK